MWKQFASKGRCDSSFRGIIMETRGMGYLYPAFYDKGGMGSKAEGMG